VLTPEGAQPAGKVVVMSMASIESSYAYHAAKGTPDRHTAVAYPS
jgi:hypothetical protein